MQFSIRQEEDKSGAENILHCSNPERVLYPAAKTDS